MPPEQQDQEPGKGDEKTFTQAEVNAIIERRLKSHEKSVRESAVKEALSGLDLDDENVTLDALKEHLAKAKGAKTDLEKTQTDLKTTQRELKKSMERTASLEGFRTNHLKRQAIAAHSAKFVDVDTVADLLGGKLTVNDKDEVVGPDGKSVEDTVTALLEAKPFLKAQGYKPGAGTGKRPESKPNDGGSNGQNGQRKTLSQLAADFAKELSGANAGGSHP